MNDVLFYMLAVAGLAVTGTSAGLSYHNWMVLKRAEHRRG